MRAVNRKVAVIIGDSTVFINLIVFQFDHPSCSSTLIDEASGITNVMKH